MSSTNTDYLRVNCVDCDSKFLSYTDPGCNAIKGKIHKMVLLACGVTPPDCPQVESEWTTLIANNEAAIITVLGEKPDATPNTVEDPYPCSQDTITENYTESFNYGAKFWKDCDTGADNYDFWNNLRRSGTIGGFYYAVEGGLLFEPLPVSGYSITVDWDRSQNNILGVKGVITYKTESLDKPWFALGSLFGC